MQASSALPLYYYHQAILFKCHRLNQSDKMPARRKPDYTYIVSLQDCMTHAMLIGNLERFHDASEVLAKVDVKDVIPEFHLVELKLPIPVPIPCSQ